MRRILYVGRLFYELAAYSLINRSPWLLLFVLALLLLSGTAIVGQALPYMYTIF